MPEVDGFAMLDSLYGMPFSPMPVVVFATAYDAYAVRASLAAPPRQNHLDRLALKQRRSRRVCNNPHNS
jgi:DNA-binding LytR/AlgR family response regulator